MSRTLRAVPFRKQRQHRESMRALAQYAPGLERRAPASIPSMRDQAADELGMSLDML